MIPLCEGIMQKNADTTISAATTSDKENVLQILYLLDRFGVSDLFYHELAMVNLFLPRSHSVKEARTNLDSKLSHTRYLQWSIPIFQNLSI